MVTLNKIIATLTKRQPTVWIWVIFIYSQLLSVLVKKWAFQGTACLCWHCIKREAELALHLQPRKPAARGLCATSSELAYPWFLRLAQRCWFKTLGHKRLSFLVFLTPVWLLQRLSGMSATGSVTPSQEIVKGSKWTKWKFFLVTTQSWKYCLEPLSQLSSLFTISGIKCTASRDNVEERQSVLTGLGSVFKASVSRQHLSDGFELFAVRGKYCIGVFQSL